MKKSEPIYEKGRTYIFVFVGEGIMKAIETKFEKMVGEIYGKFDCGIEVRISRINDSIDSVYYHPFNVTNSKNELYKYMPCALYVFSSKETMKAVLPKIVKTTLDAMVEKANELRDKFVEVTDDISLMENYVSSIEKGKFEIEKISDK